LAYYIKVWSRRDPAYDSHGYSDSESRVGIDGKTHELGYKTHTVVNTKSDMPIGVVVASANENERPKIYLCSPK
jgi:hypothetical protein